MRMKRAWLQLVARRSLLVRDLARLGLGPDRSRSHGARWRADA
jgi:hypothetical protein